MWQGMAEKIVRRQKMQDYVVGIDIGGTTIKLAIFPKGEKDICSWEIKTRAFNEIEGIWQDITDAIWAKFDELGFDHASLKAAGMDLPGPIREDGYIPWCVNLGMGECYPAEELSKVLGVPVKAGNDANVAALGEVYYGAAKKYENAALFTLGTGVGGGIIQNGKIIAGNRGVAGEVGHFVVNPDEEETCNCGNKGCLEQYASATGMVRTAKRLLAKSDKASVLRDTEISAKSVCDAAKAGDEIALEAMDIYGKYMGIAAAHIMCTTDPDAIIIGGGVSKAGQIVIDPVKKYIEKFGHIAQNKPEVVLAELGNDAGTYGAAALALELL